MTIQLELTAITPGGDAMGRHEGLVIFTPYGLPGELVEVEIIDERRNFARARLLRVVRSSPDRVAAHCRHFGLCGGCQWQCMSYPAQLNAKHAIVSEQLRRIAHLQQPAVRPCIPSPSPYRYRNHARLALSASGKAGYRAASSNQIIEIDECPILEEGLEQRLQHLPMSELEPNLSVKPLSAAEWNLRWTQPTIRLGDWEYIVSPSSFFQANTAVAALLVEQVLAALQLHGDEHILDLYSGVGLFTLPIASQAARVIGVESNPAAAQDAQRNLAHYPNVEIITAEVAQALQTGLLQQKWDAVILDPPRAGVDHAAMRQICALQTCRLVYVSCNPATLARDIKILCANGYVLEYAQPLDMFPQTHHVETAAFLERR